MRACVRVSICARAPSEHVRKPTHYNQASLVVERGLPTQPWLTLAACPLCSSHSAPPPRHTHTHTHAHTHMQELIRLHAQAAGPHSPTLTTHSSYEPLPPSNVPSRPSSAAHNRQQQFKGGSAFSPRPGSESSGVLSRPTSPYRAGSQVGWQCVAWSAARAHPPKL